MRPVRECQLTLDEWAATLAAEATPPPEPAPTGSQAPIAEAVASEPAEGLSGPAPASPEEPPASQLLTLDELIAELPRGKKPQTWKRWLYERTRRGEVPGCVKLGGMLFFQRERTLAWFRGGATATR
jgi:hypothetical protein